MHRSLSLTLSLALCSFSLAAHADDASKRAKAEQMLAVTKVDTVSQQMLANVPARVRALASRQVMVEAASTPEQKKLVSDYLDQMQGIASSGAKWDAVHPKIVDLYVANFTEPEMDGILAFYKTPAGQALVTKTPEVSGKTVELLQTSLNGLEPQFQAATKAFQTQMQNTSPVGGPAAAGGPAAPASKAPTLSPAIPNSAPNTTPRK